MTDILLVSNLSGSYNRLLMKGVIRFSKEIGSWRFHRVPLYYCQLHGDEVIPELVKKWHIRAVIGQLPESMIVKLQRLGIPVMVQNYSSRIQGVSNITGDYWNTGVMAAEFFLKRRFRHFAFCGTRSTVWSREREDGYAAYLRGRGFEVASYNFRGFLNDKTDPRDFIQLQAWLEALPKPVAIFACDDACALELTDLCRLSNIGVPEDASILGVDDDEILCNMSDPSLSSIVLDVENGGYEAAGVLYRMIEQQTLTNHYNVVICPVKIQERQSTERYVVSDPVVKAILAQLNGDAGLRISLKELFARVPFSRRVCEKRFKAIMDITIYQYMLDRRVTLFADLLLSSSEPVKKLMMDCGFEDYANLSRLFKRYKRMTPLQYRQHFAEERRKTVV